VLFSEFRNLPKAREKVYPMPIQRRFMKPTPVDPQAPAIAGDRLFDVKKAATYLGVGREPFGKWFTTGRFRMFTWAKDSRSIDWTWTVGLRSGKSQQWLERVGSANGNRTRVSTLRGSRPRPLDDSATEFINLILLQKFRQSGPMRRSHWTRVTEQCHSMAVGCN
jgi:hypothetical protein